MTTAERRRLKQLVDARRRELARDGHGERYTRPCAGCGGHPDVYTRGCDTCRTRRNSRAKRAREVAA